MNVLIAFGGYGSAGSAGTPVTRAGAELMAICTGTALAGRGHQIAFCTDRPPATDPPILALGCRRPAGAAELPWIPDVVHAFDLAKPAVVRYGLELARRLGVPFVLTPSSARQVWPDVWFCDEACASADQVLALTGSEIADLALPDPRLARRVGQGPSLTDRSDPAAFRRSLPGDGPLVLFLGRRSRLKGLDVLALAAPLVWRVVPEAIFAAIGPPGDAADAVAALGDPRFVDFGAVDLQTKTDAIAGCTVLCLPSRADVFPLVFVEAWTLGRPVVSGAFRGAAEVVRHRVDGLVCPVRPEAVAEAVAALLTDPQLGARLGAAGQERAARELTWSAVAAAVECCYRDLAGSGRGY